VRNLKPAGLVSSAAFANFTPPVTAKTSGKIQGNQPEEAISGYGGKDFEKKV